MRSRKRLDESTEGRCS